MPSTIDILAPFNRIQPGPFFSRYSDWILFSLLLFFFWAVAGISLKKRFEESRYLRVLVTSIALMLSIGTYFSVYRGWLHLSLEGLGFLGAVLLLIVVFFIVFGLMRGYGVGLSNALPIGFAVFYISLWAVSPNILDTLNHIFPAANAILLLLFIVSIFKIVFAFFRYAGESPLDTAKRMPKTPFASLDNTKIDDEIYEEKKERSIIKKQTMKFTKLEIKSLDNIEECLKEIINIIKKSGNAISSEEVSKLFNLLRKIGQNENILKKGNVLINEHIASYKKTHRKDISELEERLNKEKNKSKQKIIEEEILYQQKMLQVLDFMKKYENKIVQFVDSFTRLIYAAMEKLKDHYPMDALSYLQNAFQGLTTMRHIYDKQKAFEKYLLKLNRKTISDLKKEKGQNK